MHYYTDIITHGWPFLTSRRHWWERVNSTLIEFHLYEASGLSGKRTRTARLTDRDANDCAISPPSTTYSQGSLAALSHMDIITLGNASANPVGDTHWERR